MEHLPGLAVMRDLQGRHIFGNAAWEKVIGKTKDATCQKTQEEIWPPEIARELQKLDQQMLQAGEPLDSLITLELADGSHHFLANRFPIKDQQGVPYMIGGIGIDVTARLRAEEEARKQTRLFEAFFDNSLTPLVFLDPQFNFIRVNQAYARACHREPDEFVGLNHFDLYPSNVRPIFAEVLTTKVPYQAVARPFSLPDYPEWGVTFWDWSLVPIVDDQGEVDFLVYSQQDVTDRVKAEEARSRLVEILENTPDIVGIADYHGKLNYLNRAGRSMVGVEENKDISGQKVLQFHPPWVKKLILEEGSPTAMREGAWKGESALLNGKGREIPISQVILAHRDRAGQMEFFSTICRDISDLKEAQESIARRGAILGAINRILREAMASETGEELGLACLEVTRELTFSQFGFIFEFFEEDKLETLACSGPCCDQGNISRLREWLQRQIINQEGGGARSMREGRAFWANDLADNPDMAEIAEGHPPLIAYLGMPLMYEGRTLGLLGLGNKAGGYTPGDQEDMEILAPAITEALIHFRYKQDLNISAKKLRYLADQLLTTQEKERKRLATELHDELGHSLLVMKFHLRAIAGRLLPEQKTIKEEINDHLAVIEGVINEVRRLYHDLTPGNIEDLGLTQALVTLIEDFAANQPEINWQVDLKDLDGLFTPPLETIIYRLVQEALTNIGKHAHPSAVTVAASLEQEKVRLAIEDNGQGFEVAEVQTRKGHHRGLGLATMEERMNMVGGSLQIWSKKKAGTRLSFTIPIRPKEDKP